MSRRSFVDSGVVLGFAVLTVVLLGNPPASAQCLNSTSCVDNNVSPAGAPCGVGDEGKCCVLNDACQSCPAGQSAHCNSQEQCVGNLTDCPNGHFCTQDADCASGSCVNGTCQPVACCSPGSNTCQLLTATQCTDARGINEGTDCTNVECTGCCQHFNGNPNACSSNVNVVTCIEGTGSPMLDATCATESGPCVSNPTATSTATSTPTATSTRTPTSTSTPTVTPTPTPLALGDACTSGTQCASTFCAPGGVCCNVPCNDPHQSCTLPGSVGLCRLLSAAPALSPAVFVVLAVLLTAAGWLVLRRRARE